MSFFGSSFFFSNLGPKETLAESRERRKLYLLIKSRMSQPTQPLEIKKYMCIILYIVSYYTLCAIYNTMYALYNQYPILDTRYSIPYALYSILDYFDARFRREHFFFTT